MKIYLLQCNSGEYDSYITWIEAASTNYEAILKAKEFWEKSVTLSIDLEIFKSIVENAEELSEEKINEYIIENNIDYLYENFDRDFDIFIEEFGKPSIITIESTELEDYEDLEDNDLSKLKTLNDIRYRKLSKINRNQIYEIFELIGDEVEEISKDVLGVSEHSYTTKLIFKYDNTYFKLIYEQNSYDGVCDIEHSICEVEPYHKTILDFK